MIKTRFKSKIVQFHHNSTYAKKLLDESKSSGYVVLQIEVVPHENFDFIAEIIKKEDYELECK